MPNPLKLLMRLLVVCGLVLWLAHQYQRTLLEPLLPLIRATFTMVEDAFVIKSLDIAQEGPNETVRLRANLAGPTYVNGRTFYPIGWGTNQEGGFQVTLTAGGTMLYSLLTLIVVLAWPAASWKMMLKRMMFAAPLMLLLVVINTTTTFPAELWKPIHDDWVPEFTWPLLVWSRILMGGGGLVLGLLCGAMVIGAAGGKKQTLGALSRQQA